AIVYHHLFIFSQHSHHHRNLHSFPTRRSSDLPSPKNSTNLPTTFSRRRISVTVSTRSVAVTPSRKRPVNSKPTTSGVRKYTGWRSEEHTSELQSRSDLVCRLLLEKKNK